MAGDDLERPLRLSASRPPRRTRRVDGITVLAFLAGATLLVVGFWALLVDDPLGGEPIATAAIERRAPAGPAAAPEAPGEHAGAAPDTAHAGVPVVRPGDAMPKSGPVIISIPGADGAADDPHGGPPAGDVRAAMLEDTRYGQLPRIAPDGKRPIDAYSRPLPAGAPAARVALVVGGLGVGREATQAAIRSLPDAVTLAFSPYGQDVGDLVAKARDAGHEVLMQAPMEPFGYPQNDTGPQTMLASLPAPANLDRLRWALARAKGYVGVAPLGGAKFLGVDGATAPVFTEIARRGLMFVGAVQADGSSFTASADRSGLPRTPAAAVVDAIADAASIDAALADLERSAKDGRVAVGWASATPLTLKRIDVWRAGLASRGVALAPVSAAIGPQGPS